MNADEFVRAYAAERRGTLFSDRPFLSGRIAPAADLDTLRFVVIVAGGAVSGGAGK